MIHVLTLSLQALKNYHCNAIRVFLLVVLVTLFGLVENQPPSTSLGTDVSFVLVTLLSGMSRVSIRFFGLFVGLD